MKICTVCNKQKELEHFNINKKLADGRTVRCKDCRNEYNRAWASIEKNKRSRQAYAKENKLEKQAYDKARYQENMDEAKKRSLASYNNNKEHRKACVKIWQQNNIEAVKIIKKNYKHKRRSLEKNGITSKELRIWIEKQVKICYWCKHNCESDFHVDHYNPLAKGGKHDTDNLVISCPPCNLKKSAKDPYLYANEKGRLL